MSLTVGTTLQNDKFAIKAILHQTDFGVTYQAAHPALNHPIILQSFNEALRQRNDFDQLRQKFLKEVLLFSKQPSETVQIIDCFEENGMPFVVLDAAADQSIPPLSSWLDIPIEASAQEIAPPKTEASALKAALAAAFPETPAEATRVTAPIAPPPIAEKKPEKSVAEKDTEAMAIAPAPEVAPVLAETLAPSFPILPSFPPHYAPNSSRNSVNVLVSEQGSPRQWMPLALMMTALITGFGGAGLGLALRFKPTPPGNSNRSLSSGWFGREQSFPPQQDWPITETPNLYSPSSAFEQPYLSSPPIRESGIPGVQPSTGYIPPDQLTSPAYEAAPPGIADYPPIPEPTPTTPDSVADPSIPETTQPGIPLPLPIAPEAPLEDLPEPAPELNKLPSASEKTPAEAPPIFHQ
ncbi:MAG: hypothetical protein HC781_13705 [Leptolyngbyaceae cyanobacterium CSU_1_4]|nr:hypothetical protein [Leptolyngbyaceae cyanobacterium CSU_1_4]